VVLQQQLLLKHELEAVGEEGGNQQDVAYHLQTLIHNRLTVSPPELLLSAKAREEAPTIRTPTRARALPATWLLLAFILRKMMEKMKVVTMEPPLIIW